MTNDDERQAITAAMQRLLAGKPLRSGGHLDVVTLAREAGVKRNKLTHKHPDLKDLFYASNPRSSASIRAQEWKATSPTIRSSVSTLRR